MSLIIFISLLFNTCLTFKFSDRHIKRKFAEKKLNVNIKRKQYHSKYIRYIESTAIPQDSIAPILLLIHGSPGSGSDFSNILMDKELRKTSKIISLDRLGYGYSNYGKSEVSIEGQVKIILKILEEYNFEKIVVLGWSYGGPIAIVLATEIKDRISGVIMIGPAIARTREKYTSLARIGSWVPFRWIISGAMKVASYEKINHQEELKKIEPIWREINFPVVHFHGDKDNIVPYKPNIQYSKKMIPKKYLTTISIPKGGHFIHLRQYDKVKKEILRLLLDN